MADDFHVDPDIGRAWTLPSAAYTDPAAFAEQRERIFGRTWHAVCATEGPGEPGRVVPFTLLPDLLDEPLVLATDDDGNEHCLSNVCTHRGNLVVTERGSAGSLRCGYHGRCFAHDGRFLSMPGFDGVESFPAPSDDLPRLPLERWGPLRFTSLDPALSFDDWIAPVRERLDWLPLDDLRHDPHGFRRYEVAAHWALYCDNYLEGFHIPFVHPELSRTLKGYAGETSRYGSLQLGRAAEGDPVLPVPADHPDEGRKLAAYYFWLFPSTMLNVYPWGLSLNVVEPLAVDRTRVTFVPFVIDETLRGEGAGAGLDRVEQQDEQIVEQVQRGVRSRLYDRGRYSPEHERCVHHFHRLFAEFVRAEG